MPRTNRKVDRIMLAVTLFTVTGAVLAYNFKTVGDGTLAVSLSELNAFVKPAAVISEAAAANLMAHDSVFTAATPTEPFREIPLDEPIVQKP